MNRYTADFLKQLDGVDFKTLEESPHSIFALSADLKFTYFNQAWFDFALKNDPHDTFWQKDYLDQYFEQAITGDLKSFYLDKFTYLLEKGESWSHEYECSSPHVYRVFIQDVYPMKNGKGLIVINSLKVEEKMARIQLGLAGINPQNYLQKDGFFHQCSNCRKTQRSENTLLWDWVPSLVEKMPLNTSHSICPTCFDYYWKV